MSKESSTARFPARNVSRTPQPEPSENEFETPANPIQFPPPRTPLNSIADPAQLQKEFLELDLDSHPKLEAVRSGRFSLSERRLVALDKGGNAGLSFGTPRVSGRGGKAHSEPNSAQSTPARNRASIGGCAVSRAPVYNGGRAGSSSRISREIPAANSEILTQVPHFELAEDSSFWTDHNVQVLIRIRPLSSMERALQGCGRCLKQESSQTLVLHGPPDARFTFDHIACEMISQEKLFKVAGMPMVENCLSGYNSCMFAYGQTGSGKTYTMMGEIYEIEGQLNDDCGITPRIFEYLFKRIRMEEENRREEQLKYSCKCSFLEIYNEQITDLLEPSSTNLQLREDLKKGVYVENLTEYNVTNVNDVVKLLLHGASNRKMAATHMNSESSRSHSVFTCIIESRWENDSMTHFRFARLNLVDLAGSERQKGSGAEGDRLKEAANINKSLSTLGLVIMSLVDLAHGKQRHVPYRDSRLTFLLQDSLGGNSKTTIIANVSPSSCSANETLSTLKFAQRAKLIQNNAKVNEDASGDITALQRHIQQLKGQLSFLMKHHNLSWPSSSCAPSIEEPRLGDLPEEDNCIGEKTETDSHKMSSVQNKKLKCMEAILVGALRREKMADNALQNLVAEIEHMNHLARERVEDDRHTKIMLRSRDEKIKRLELLVDGMLSAEKYLMEENKALLEEMQMLQTRPDGNPELTRYAVENSRLLEQLQLYKKFYEHGERETLLAEVSELRNQLLDILQKKLPFSTENESQNSDIRKELEDCRNMNSKLIREVDELQLEMRKYMSSSQAASDSVRDSFSKGAEEFRQSEKYSMVETLSVRSDSGDEMASYTEADDEALQNHVIHNQNGDDTRKKLMDAKMLTEAGKSEQACLKSPDFRKESMGLLMDSSKDVERRALQAKLDKMAKDLEEVKSLNSHFQEDKLLQLSCQKQTEMVCEQVEIETARTILHLQEEVAALQLELDEKLQGMVQENTALKNTIASKEDEIRTLKMDWEKATLELTRFLLDGSRSLKNASSQIKRITHSFSQANVCISENVQRAAKVCLEKEETIILLQKSLEDAQKMVTEMGQKLSSLKGATMALSELQHLNSDEKMKSKDLHHLIHEIKNELTVANGRLKNIEDFVYMCPSGDSVLGDEDEWSTDSSMSGCDTSSESISSGHVLWTMEGHLGDLKVEEGPVLQSAYQDPEKSNKLLKNFTQPEGATFCLKKELEITLDAFNTLYVRLASLVSETVSENHSQQGVVKQIVPLFKLKMENAYAGCHTTEKLVGEKSDFASSFLINFEEAHATIKEADFMLNALLEANENSKQLTGLWKQTGEELMLERASFIKEVEHLKSSVLLKERENKLLKNQSYSDLAEIEKSVSLLEECFMQLKSDVEDRFKVIYADVFSMGSEIRNFISSSRSFLEETCSEALEKEFAMFVLHQCLRGELVCNMSCVNLNTDYQQFRKQEGCSEMNKLHKIWPSGEESTMLIGTLCIDDGDQREVVTNLKESECGLSHDPLVHENLVLKEELERKEALLEGVHFDFRMLQESASSTKDIKDETEKLIQSLSQIQLELEMKTCHLDDMLVEHRKLEDHLTNTEKALLISNSNLEQANETVKTLSEQNIELKVLLKDLYLNKVEAEEQLEEQKEVVKGLEKEILHLNSSMDEKVLCSVEGIQGDLRKAISERDRLHEEVQSLNDKLEMACAIADENEAISVEARQEAERSKMYAEQKEEEVKILENSVEELECTINVLEKKVYEMDDEVERHRLIRDALELELQALRQRLSTVENFTENADSENTKAEEDEDLISRQLQSKLLELHEAHNRIKLLEEERAEWDKEIKQCKEYISELVLHAEAQASQYQQKYKTLEAMVSEVKADKTCSTTTAATSVKTERSSIRTRGSGSPFRCISTLVQQMNTEKDQELSTARLRIEELEALAASRQKEVCLLNTRLAATESMTHDVIRDLLGVKLDMTNYADLIDQYQVQKLVEEAHQQTEDFLAKEQEILNLRKQINDLMEERQSCISEIEKKEGDILAAQMSVQELQERDQMLSAQNEMLKTDKANLKRRVSELDDMVKTILGTPSTRHPSLGTPSTRHPSQQTSTNKKSAFRLHDGDFTRRLEQSEKHLSRVNGELAQYIKSGGGQVRDKRFSHGSELDNRKQKNLSLD
ncbi:putative plus-end-directed kinesin ATPase [Rosa chinensis]|uniref:Putative plus-end-directed kinesin ATPase n=1 Tax=Rosa chinensis TaxID=74649 RepID=A0A2P6QZF8_ROSCH|nr:kinesin-like protein KIN-12C [Rosa chinensis]PRQ39572.1 putative plus-end-directed kinesin ATPase [Rosa chinensis]